MTNIVASLKTAVITALEASGGIDSVEKSVRVGRSQLGEYRNRNSQLMAPVDVAVEIDRLAQHPHILSAMAAAEGYRLIPMHFGEGNIPRDLSKFAAATSDVLQEGLQSLEDGQVDIAEAHTVLRHAQKAGLQLAQLEASMRKIIDDGKPHVVFPAVREA
ncbi:MAG: hypothetical protein ACTIDN_06380 [Acetobacter sp.]|uniref:hypothetical protein n=1 Tax=Acetobacter sp. TaxID=440 RepID=UPI003F8FB9F8